MLLEVGAVRRQHLDAKVTAWSSDWSEGFKRGGIATQMSGAWLAGHLNNWLAPGTKGLWRASQLPEGTWAAFGGTFFAIARGALDAPALAADIAREHARRIGHDWPRAWGAPSQTGALSDWPKAGAGDSLPDWLRRHWLGQSPASWLHDLDHAAGEFDPVHALAILRRSAQRCPGGIAPVLARAVELSLSLPFPSPPAVAALRLDDPAQARALGTAMTTPGFCRAPSRAGDVPDTGPWNRLAQPMTTTAPGLAARLLSRWIELLRLALPELPRASTPPLPPPPPPTCPTAASWTRAMSAWS